MDLGLANATAVVVDGSRGTGLAASRCLASDGARVALVGRTQARIDSAVADLTEHGSPDAVGFAVDIGDAAEVDKVFAAMCARCNGELNVLINTVGPGAPGGLEDLTDDQWRAAVEDGAMGMLRRVPVVAFLASGATPTSANVKVNVDGGCDFT
ncbi:SDR family NAD(P)-dependent oxidoreductase [Mycobacterium lentiflavum]|uniref:SDR family NAD(P)-dependent oxidoreductase n=1 Tax=Mycobacterium lentiflavum TaxID=141349 RepID=A0ABY3UNE8_MYCLN|nr:SDR family NAD(P)-dependent oxidoreductase [Mycobacterium lentiflavum]ULP41125.1 SDR family NAD(P)-dependent oxidoreductase [Mycobacterium lentiflavum]